MNDYYKKSYGMSVSDGCDTLTVRKSNGDWSHIEMDTNGSDNGKITIRSKAMAEQLQFMLGQMLGA